MWKKPCRYRSIVQCGESGIECETSADTSLLQRRAGKWSLTTGLLLAVVNKSILRPASSHARWRMQGTVGIPWDERLPRTMCDCKT